MATRQDFFQQLKQTLLAHDKVKDLSAVETARTPVMKFEFNGVQIDLLLASCRFLVFIPDSFDIDDDKVIYQCGYGDDATVTSLNGRRVTDKILRLVPNKDNFRIALRCIKFWAKGMSISSILRLLLFSPTRQRTHRRLTRMFQHAVCTRTSWDSLEVLRGRF
jgi:poly(A) polymerase